MRIGALGRDHRAAIYLVIVLLVAGGIYALATLPAAIYPEIAYPRIVVLAHAETFDGRSVTAAVTRPIEEALSGTLGLRLIRSTTVRGGAEIDLDFTPGSDMPQALQQVQGRLAALQGTLPPGVDLSAERLTPSVFPIIQYELTGASPVELRELAEFTIRPRLIGLPDVGGVEVQGGRVREIAVTLDPVRLVANRISADRVAAAIAATNVVVDAGRIDRQYRQYSVIVSAQTATPDAVGEVVVSAAGAPVVRVRDLGTISFGPEDRFQITSGNGQPAALVNVARQPNGQTLVVQRAVEATVDTLRSRLPAGVKLEPVYDQAALVRDSLASVRDAMVVGGLLAVAILFLFLGQIRATIAAALTLPLAVLITFFGMKVLGDTLNLMSLGGLAVAIGLIIDDAVVVVENIERRLGHPGGLSPAGAIEAAVDEVVGPVVGSTLTTIVVFAPLGLLDGVVGDFFKSFSIALAISVLISLFLAFTLIPALLLEYVRLRGFSERAGRVWLPLDRLESGYARLLARALDRPRIVLAAVLVIAAGALGLTRVMETGFLPGMDEGGFILDYWAPTGSSLDETDRQMKIIESILHGDPDVQAFSRRTGAELGLAITPGNRGDFTVLLRPRGVREASADEIINRIRLQVEAQAPAVRVEFVQLLQDIIGDLAGAPEPVEVKLFSPDHAAAEAAGRSLGEALDSVPGLVDLYDGVAGDNPEMQLTLDPVRLARLGLTPADAGEQVRSALFGASAGSAREADRLVPIRVRLNDEARFNPAIVATLPLIGPTGWMPLGSAGVVQDSGETSEFLRENLRPLVRVTGRVEGSSLGSVMKLVRQAVSRVRMPSGVTVEFGGQYASQQAAFRQLLLVLGLAASAVLLVLVAQFGQFRGPGAIVLAAPLGLTGALLALWMTGVAFNVSSFMGLILLIGLVVKNGIIYFDAARRFHRGGMPSAESLVAAGRLRLRPILMTTLCTLAGLIPLALGWGAGAELQRPLAVAVVGGLTLSTLVTLILLPVGLASFGALGARGGEEARAGEL